MPKVTVDGVEIEVPQGATVLQACELAGKEIPRFCYHERLSIAGNCRMCLVEVKPGPPKPQASCALPATDGQEIRTDSPMVKTAREGVMEFLLMNHPLDCPICDQGGECQLQDLAVGYGEGQARFQEEKRVVMNKNLGPLVSTDMTRCINCTRCVRFTQEIGGFQELGQAFRGDRAEIMPFLGQTLDSELSGNIIDLCPVGALTSKPFRFTARSWELSRRRSVSPHDGLGSNLIVQTKLDRVMRVLPLENEDVNECWLSDKDRYSYEGVNSPDRLTKPMVKQGGKWQEVEWNVALDYAAHALRDVAKTHGAAAIGALVSPHSTLEEMALAAKLMRGLGSDNVDFRLRQADFSLDGKRKGAPWLGMKVAELNKLDRVLLVGSFVRKDQPLLAQRLRQAVKNGAKISVLHSADEDLLVKTAAKVIVAPSQLPALLAQVVKAASELKHLACDMSVTVSAEAKAIAASLVEGSNSAILLGNFAQQHPQAGSLQLLAQQLAQVLGAKFGALGEAANSVGGYVAKALPQTDGLNAARLVAEPRRAYLVLGAEPELDCADGRAALAALKAADSVIVMSPFKSAAALEYADAILPVSPFTETSGSFVNTEGRVQSVQAVCKPRGDTRPAWKVLRALGSVLELPGFGYESSEEVRNEILGGEAQFVAGLDNGAAGTANLVAVGGGVERIADVPAYFADALVRRAHSLQKTKDAAVPTARMNAATLAKFGVSDGDRVRVKAGAGEALLAAQFDAALPDGCVRVAAAHAATAGLGAMFGQITLERM